MWTWSSLYSVPFPPDYGSLILCDYLFCNKYMTTGALSTELLNLIWVLYKFSLKINEGKVLHDFPHKVILSQHKQILTNKNGWISVFRGKCFCVSYSQTITIIRHISWLLHWIPLAPRISLTYRGLNVTSECFHLMRSGPKK